MKEITKSSRLLGQLEKLYRMINSDLFNGELQPVTITVQSTPRAYGHIILGEAWSVKGEGSIELNIGAGTLDRPIEEVVATLVHECCHLLNFQNGISDCSNHNVYHNKSFKETAEAHGLIVTHSEKYGWTHTTPDDPLIAWILENDIPDILMNRIVGKACPRPSSTRKLICPNCGLSVRATKAVNILCGDCMVKMNET
jgi:hypothetical protein